MYSADVGLRLLWFSILPLIFVVGCASSKNWDDSSEDLKKQIVELEKIQVKQNAQIEELNNKILMLKDQIDGKFASQSPKMEKSILPEIAVNPLAPKAATEPNLSTSPVPAFQTAAPSPPSKPMSKEEKFYQQAILDAKRPQLFTLEKDVDTMLKQFHDSPLTNNLLFMYADSLFDRGEFAKSATQFERLYKLFPDGNKAVAALYKLGICYQRMGHPREAQEAFQNLVTVYPGSREALDAEKQILGNDGGVSP